MARVHPPGLAILAHQADEGVDLSGRDVLLQQFSVVVEQSRDRVLGQHVIADLLLHEAELFGYIFLVKLETHGDQKQITHTRTHTRTHTLRKRAYATNSGAC